jgi:probable HAF family extracellular repeat protein
MRATLLIAFFTVIMAQSSPIGTGTVQDLGTLGSSGAVAYRISDAGQVVGWSPNVYGLTQGFLYGSNGLLDLSNSLNGAESYAYGVNSSGTATGSFYVNGQAHGVIWNGAGYTDLGANTYGAAINDTGQVAGGDGQAFLYSDGSLRQLGYLPGGNWSAAYAVNDSGAVAGYGTEGPGQFRGFVWYGGALVPLGTLGGSSSYAFDLNNSGQVAGAASTSSGYLHAFLDSNGRMVDLGTLGGSSSYAYGLNDSGYAVGYSSLANGSDHAFLYANGQLIDLNSLLPSGSGWQLLQAYGINDNNQIVGTGLFDGQQHAFEFNFPGGPGSQTPESSTSVLLLCGATLLALLHFFRRRRSASPR